MYFGKEVERAIEEFNHTELRSTKEQLFNQIIYPALNKLAENVIHNRKHYNYGNTNDYTGAKHDCVVHLHSRLHKFKPERGHKAFSYFNRVAINWVFANMRQVIEDAVEIGDIEIMDSRRDVVNEMSQLDYQEDLKDFCYKWSIWGNLNLDHFYFVKDDKKVPFTKRDKQIVNAIFNLFEKPEQIDIYNKKALYILIREQFDVKTQAITDIVNWLRPLQQKMYKDYMINGTTNWDKIYEQQ